jgi:hypothetical protein
MAKKSENQNATAVVGLKEKSKKSKEKRNANTVVPVIENKAPSTGAATVDWNNVINKVAPNAINNGVGANVSVNLTDIMNSHITGDTHSFVSTKGPSTSTNVNAGVPNSNNTTTIEGTDTIPTGSTVVATPASSNVDTKETTGTTSTTGTTNTTEEKPKTLSDYLEDQRKAIKQEKTDAVKMQKYYALTDALKSLGKMGGVALGGYLGGNMLDSAPQVGEYKESRGYLDAFENAKKANERLRNLEEKGFQLEYAKQQAAEERAYKANIAEIERKYKAEQDQLAREWQAEQNRITREWNAAVAEKDFERQAALKKELAEFEQAFKLKYQSLENKNKLDLKEAGYNTVQQQYQLYNTVPIGFKNGKGITVPKPYYEDMQEFFIGDEWVGSDGVKRKVTKDNVLQFIKNNPDRVNEYLNMFGLGEKPATTQTAAETTKQAGIKSASFPMNMSQIPAELMNVEEEEDIEDDPYGLEGVEIV